MAKTISKEQILSTLHLKHDDAAKALGVSRGTLSKYKKIHDIKVGKGNTLAVDAIKKPGRPSKKSSIEVVCECGNSFETKKTNRKYCSNECYHKYKVVVITEEAKLLISEKAKARWETPTNAMLEGIEKRKLSDEELCEYRKYRNRLANLTEKTYNAHKEEINPNDYKRAVAGVEDAYHLDHIIPAKFGFDNNIPPEVLAEKNNLQMLPWRDNIVKGKHID